MCLRGVPPISPFDKQIGFKLTIPDLDHTGYCVWLQETLEKLYETKA